MQEFKIRIEWNFFYFEYPNLEKPNQDDESDAHKIPKKPMCCDKKREFFQKHEA
jgi:hypothetical protein